MTQHSDSTMRNTWTERREQRQREEQQVPVSEPLEYPGWLLDHVIPLDATIDLGADMNRRNMESTVDTTDTACNGWDRHSREDDQQAKLETAAVAVASLTLLVGNLEVYSTGPLVHGSNIRLNGQPFPVKSIKIEGDAKGLWNVVLEYYPGLNHQGGQ